MKILVLGAGRMGQGAAFDLLKNSFDVELVTIADYAIGKAESMAAVFGDTRIVGKQLDVSDENAVTDVFRKHDAVISCVNYWHNSNLTRIAIETNTHFCDLGGNNYVVDEQLALNSKAIATGVNVIPDCGLAPGMVSILAMHGFKQFDSVEDINIRVGGLPQIPKPPLDYQLIFSVEGLINEYIEVARVIREGEIMEVESMTENEALSFPGFPDLEAFQTSGGTSTLPETFKGKVRNLDYKTIRYAGHCEKFKAMIDLGLCRSDQTFDLDGVSITPRRFFARLLEENLPAEEPDYVLVRVCVTGTKDGKKERRTYDIIDTMDEANGLSSMMRMTAFPASIIAQMMVREETTAKGAIPQEIAIDSEKFINELSKRGIDLIESIEQI
jgi:lysine 6-dehydrogenase